MLRVIAGTAKGTRLETPKDRRLRPTLDRVRESLFNILAPRLPDARFADLFAGTGANGIEALSRGAASCVFVDSDPQSLDLIQRNTTRAKLSDRATILRAQLPAGISALVRRTGQLDIIFADPPFDYTCYEDLLNEIGSQALVVPEGLIIIEHASDIQIPDNAGLMCITRNETYGRTALSFFA